MGHKAHVGLVDAHAEGHGGDHDDAVFAQEAVLVALAHLGVQASVIRQSGDALLVQPVGGFFHLAAALAVDDAGVAVVLVADEAQQLLARVVLFDQGVADVGPVEAADEDAGVLQLQALDHVGTGVVVGGGGQRQARHVREALVQHAELQIVFTEVVAPLADAVRLVDGEQAEQAALVQAGQLRLKAQVGDALGRGVEHHHAAGHHLALDALGVFQAEGAVQEGRVHADFFERADLVVHQRNQGGHDHGDTHARAVSRDGGHLVTQALAATRGHQHQGVVPGCDVVDDGLLLPPKGGVAEDFLQDGQRFARVHSLGSTRAPV